MNGAPNDLEERTALYAEEVRGFVRKLPRTISNLEDVIPIAQLLKKNVTY